MGRGVHLLPPMAAGRPFLDAIDSDINEAPDQSHHCSTEVQTGPKPLSTANWYELEHL